jgi:beta-lactamase class A
LQLTAPWLKPTALLSSAMAFFSTGCLTTTEPVDQALQHFTLDYRTPVDVSLQAKVEAIDTELRARYGMAPEQAAVGVLDLKRLRVAMIRPDDIEYAASVAKIGILLAFFERHPEAVGDLDPKTRQELGQMIKASSNEMAAKFSREMGLAAIQEALNSHDLYDRGHGGGIWVGKHYGQSDERIPDPVGGHSHAATVRQLLRFYLLMEQGKLVSPAASKTMREIFASPGIPHDQIKFVKGLAGRNVEILRKWGSWQNWLHDSALIVGPGRHYIIVALTNHAKGDEYLVELARAVDDLMAVPAAH